MELGLNQSLVSGHLFSVLNCSRDLGQLCFQILRIIDFDLCQPNHDVKNNTFLFDAINDETEEASKYASKANTFLELFLLSVSLDLNEELDQVDSAEDVNQPGEVILVVC